MIDQSNNYRAAGGLQWRTSSQHSIKEFDYMNMFRERIGRHA